MRGWGEKEAEGMGERGSVRVKRESGRENGREGGREARGQAK